MEQEESPSYFLILFVGTWVDLAEITIPIVYLCSLHSWVLPSYGMFACLNTRYITGNFTEKEKFLFPK